MDGADDWTTALWRAAAGENHTVEAKEAAAMASRQLIYQAEALMETGQLPPTAAKPLLMDTLYPLFERHAVEFNTLSSTGSADSQKQRISCLSYDAVRKQTWFSHCLTHTPAPVSLLDESGFPMLTDLVQEDGNRGTKRPHISAFSNTTTGRNDCSSSTSANGSKTAEPVSRPFELPHHVIASEAAIRTAGANSSLRSGNSFAGRSSDSSRPWEVVGKGVGPVVNSAMPPGTSGGGYTGQSRSGAGGSGTNNEVGSVDHDAEPAPMFRSAREQLLSEAATRQTKGSSRPPTLFTGRGAAGEGRPSPPQLDPSMFGQSSRSLGPRRGPPRFNPPVSGHPNKSQHSMGGGHEDGVSQLPLDLPPKLQKMDPKIVETVLSEIMDSGAQINWNDIAGLEFAKKTMQEIIVLPMLRPDIFIGLRGPPKGLLLFGPPGTGKTLIGRCVASQSKATFFSISASSMTSKWVGEGEKLVRALFAVAKWKKPAVVFIDEIDSLLSQRSSSEHESSRRIKTEFLVQMDGVTSTDDERVLVIGATNRPQELDEAARRRFVKRLYIPLPESTARKHIITHLLSTHSAALTLDEVEQICTDTAGYSGADMANLCKEAALGPVRALSLGDIETITLDQVRPIGFADFKAALKQVRASVCTSDLDSYISWNKQFGSWDIQ